MSPQLQWIERDDVCSGKQMLEVYEIIQLWDNKDAWAVLSKRDVNFWNVEVRLGDIRLRSRNI